MDQTKAKIKVRAQVDRSPLRGPKRWTDLPDIQGKVIAAEIETTTDVPAQALGEVTAECLAKAWKSGIDPTKKFRLVVEFS